MNRVPRLKQFMVLGAVACMYVVSCSDDGDPTPSASDAGFQVDATNDAAAVSDNDAGTADAGIPPVPQICQDFGATPQPFKTADSSFNFGDIAGDFTVNELDGRRWNLLENWTGCESYVFINYISIPVRSTHVEIFNSPVDDLVQTPLNSHIFFTSTESSNARADRVAQWKARVDAVIDRDFPDPADNAAQKARFHYVIDDPAQIAGSVGAFYTSYVDYANSAEALVDLGERGRASAPLPYFFAIDRDQEWDSGGSPTQVVGGTAAARMASYLPAFFNHKASLRDAQAIETGIQTFALIDEALTERVVIRSATLPSASEMAAFDTLEFDVSVNCPHRNVFACSEWDRIARISLCDNVDCDSRTELVRWITPYWRRGERRWVMDASALLALIRTGGARSFRIEFGPTWERATSRDVRVVLRLSNQNKGETSGGVIPAFGGGSFDDEYNNRSPLEFMLPANGRRAELVVIVSGHGQDDVTNCAEWCDHRHQFTVNGTPNPEIRHVGSIGSIGGCGPAAAQGVPPGQWGNWAPERAYWCPGLPVDHIRVDITPSVQFGQLNTLTYSANLMGVTGRVGNGNISLSSYIVWYE